MQDAYLTGRWAHDVGASCAERQPLCRKKTSTPTSHDSRPSSQSTVGHVGIVTARQSCGEKYSLYLTLLVVVDYYERHGLQRCFANDTRPSPCARSCGPS